MKQSALDHQTAIIKQSALDHQTAILFPKKKQIQILVSCKKYFFLD